MRPRLSAVTHGVDLENLSAVSHGAQIFQVSQQGSKKREQGRYRKTGG